MQNAAVEERDNYALDADGFYEESGYYEGYADGNLAVAPQERPYVEPEREPLRKPEPQRKQETQRRVRRVVDPQRQKSKRSFVLFSGVLLCGMLSIVVMYAQTFSRQREISKLETQLAAAQQQTAMLEETAEQNMSMSELYAYATEVLGMTEAEAEDIICVDVEAHSFTTDYTVGAKKEAKVVFHWFG